MHEARFQPQEKKSWMLLNFQSDSMDVALVGSLMRQVDGVLGPGPGSRLRKGGWMLAAHYFSMRKH